MAADPCGLEGGAPRWWPGQPVRTSLRGDGYRTRFNEHAVVSPYTAVLSLGQLGGGDPGRACHRQARHLGGRSASAPRTSRGHPAARKPGASMERSDLRQVSSPPSTRAAHRSVAGKAVWTRSWRPAAGPDRITAPTRRGAKTSAIRRGNVLAVRSPRGDGGREGPRLPRRLVMTVDRRVLVRRSYEGPGARRPAGPARRWT